MTRQLTPVARLFARTCARCGCPIAEFTSGCKTCYSRQWYRKHSEKSADPDACNACGCPADELTRGCRTCYQRRYRRRRRAA